MTWSSPPAAWRNSVGSATPSYRGGSSGLNFGDHYTRRKLGVNVRRPAALP